MLEMEDVYQHCGGVGCRSFFEGSALAKSGFILEIKVKQKSEKYTEIFALCLQTSDLDGKPHEISITLEAAVKVTPDGRPKKGYDIKNAMCSCKAGSHKCKHISGVLIKLERTEECNVEHFSQTEIEQQWGKNPGLSEKAKSLYTQIPAKQFPCNQEEKKSKKGDKGLAVVDNENEPDDMLGNECMMNELSSRDFEEAYAYLITASTKPAIELHRKRRHEIRINENHVEEIPSLIPISDELTNLLQTCGGVSLFKEENGQTEHIYYNHISPLLRKFYDENVRIKNSDVCSIFQTTAGQINVNWKAQRQVRITGSIAYEFYTYKETSDEKWNAKLKRIILPTSHVTTSAMQHGKNTEPIALDKFEIALKRSNGGTLIRNLGLLVNEREPWLGYSGDALLCENDEIILIEVKCPEPKGDEMTGDQLLDAQKCLIKTESIMARFN